MSKKYLVSLGITIGIIALVVSAANLGITLADVNGLLNIFGDK